MITKEGYAKAKMTEDRDGVINFHGGHLEKDHPVLEEFELKNQLMTAVDRPDFIMELGAYMQRAHWNETALTLIKMAAESASAKSDFEIFYSAGEYFHNLREDVNQAAVYFEKSAVAAVDIITKKNSRKELRDLALQRAKIVAGLVPERGEQGIIVEALAKERRWAELREIIDHLYRESQLGTAAVFVWAQYVKEIGNGEDLISIIDGDWMSNHQLSSDAGWVEAMNDARTFVKRFTTRGGQQAEL